METVDVLVRCFDRGQRREAVPFTQNEKKGRSFMAREKPDYRATLEQLNELYPGRELLTIEEVKTVTGYRTANSIRRHFPSVCAGRYNKTTVARILAGGAPC